MEKKQNGFTLVELAIALMVIGLLIGGVLKGQELIENAKVTAFIRQVKAYDTAVMIFRNTYGALPGDIKRPNRIPNCNAELCNVPGNGNGKFISTDSTPPRAEIFNFFPHLTKAGMIQGPEGGVQAEIAAAHVDKWFPMTAFDNHIGVQSNIYAYTDFASAVASQNNRYAIPPFKLSMADSDAMVPLVKMAQIDTKMDDGLPFTGEVQLLHYNGGDCADIEDNEYAEDILGGLECNLSIRTGF